MSAFDLKNIFNTEKLEGFFAPQKDSAIGIDIGNGSIKIVELERKKEGICLNNYAYIKIKNSESFTGNARYQVAGETLKKVKQELNWKIESANVSVPFTSALLTSVDFWSASDEEINQRIKVEASKYIPIPLSEVIYGWKIIEKKPQEKEEKKDVSDKPSEDKSDEEKKQEAERKREEEKKKVVVVAVMKDISRKYEEILSSCEIAVDTLEVDVFSLARCFSREKDKGFLVVDLGEASANLAAVLGGSPVLAKNVSFGGSRITQLIAHFLKIDALRANKLKMEQGLNINSGEIKEGMMSILSSFKEEIVSMLEAFNADFSSTPIEKIVLVGGGSNLPGLKEYLEKELKLKIEQGKTFEGILLPEKIKEKLNASACFFSVAVGLALLDLKRKEK